MDATGARSQVATDIAWIGAMRREGLSEGDMAKIFAAKDLFSRERRDYAQRQMDLPEEDEG